MRRRFTLIEVVVAIAVLALSLTGLLQMLSQSQLRIADAEEKWREMHMLTQAAEYLLMISDTNDLHVPDEVFPYEDYLIDCTVTDADGLPEEFNGQSGQLPLKKWTVTLIRAADREERLSVAIDRLGYGEADDAR